MNRSFAWVCLLFVATACGAETSVSLGQPGPLPVEEWCAQYRQVMTSSGFDHDPPESFPEPGFVSMMEKLKGLAEQAPLDIREDLRAVWIVPEEVLRSAPASAAAPPENWPELLAPHMERSMRWISDNCGDVVPPPVSPEGELVPPPVPSGGEIRPPDPPNVQPVGDWQVIQRGSVGDSQWTLFRTEAADGGVCVSFESEPPYVDWQARIQAQAPPGVTVPPMPPPPDGLPKYKGKLAQCGPKPDLFERSEPVVFWVEDQNETNRYNVLAGLVVEEARSLTVSFKEGGQKVVTLVDRTFVATYDPKLHVAKVVPDLGPGSQVICDPLSYDGLPPGMPEFFALACHGSYTRSGLPVPSFDQPKG